MHGDLEALPREFDARATERISLTLLSYYCHITVTLPLALCVTMNVSFL